MLGAYGEDGSGAGRRRGRRVVSRVFGSWLGVALAVALAGCGAPVADPVVVDGAEPASLSPAGAVGPASGDALVVGIQTPVGGARPWPVVAEGEDLYWRWMTDVQGHRVLGRSRVEVRIVDDGSAGGGSCPAWPTDLFVVAAWSDPSLVAACAPEADRAGLPYVVASPAVGSSEAALQLVPSLERQLVALAELVGDEPAAGPLGLVVPAREVFDGAVASWVDVVGPDGPAAVIRPDLGDVGWVAATARELVDSGVDVAVVVGSALDLLDLARAVGTGGPQLVMVGSHIAAEPVLRAGCPHIDGTLAVTLVPPLAADGPGVEEFREAAERFGVVADDLAWSYWWLASQQHELLRWYESRMASGPPDRGSFREALQEHPRARSAGSDSGGPAEQLHVLVADCASGTWADHGVLEVGR
jgi:hypothetical protein